MVYLATKNIITKRLSKKLNYKYIGLYKVTKKLLENNYELYLLLKIRIYPIFYISLLKNAKDVNPTETERNDVKIKDKKYETEKILNICKKNGQIEYLIK